MRVMERMMASFFFWAFIIFSSSMSDSLILLARPGIIFSMLETLPILVIWRI